MNKYLVILLIFITSCSGDTVQSLKLGVEQTVRIPVEFVTVSVGVTERGTDVIVEQEGYERLAEVVLLLTESGFDQEEMEINSGEVVQNTYNREETFVFNSTVIFDLFDLDKVDSLRRALTQAGATSFRITSYGNTDEESIYNEAYQTVINSAKQHAERLLADEMVAPGRILNLHENVREFVGRRGEVRELAKQVDINISGGLELGGAPLFNKEFYTKEIVFNVEFELVEK